ncbi:substrate-binding periplasmic protein [Psychrobacter sp. I-STPA10]|uniref:substrate-binding periplasmic protein n=1 Tax=Psychrobacter sp. I-STPA10 TaxID=2585769 RepID=UPI001E3091A1|nr:transporter substrate-binding domain-containing protein [Psychrobacter sp. I-STPA10]
MTLYHALFSFPLIATLSLVGCNQSTQDTVDSQDDTSVSTDTADTSLPVLNVATYGGAPPFAFLDTKGELVGIDIDTIKAIGELEGFRVHFTSMPQQHMFASVESGANDLAIAGISYSDDRAAKYGLSKSYIFVPAAIMYEKTNTTINDKKITIHGLEDLKGLNVSGIKGSKQVEQMKDVGGYNQLSEPNSIFFAFKEMVNKQSDAIFEDRQVLEYLAKSYPEYQFDIVDYEDMETPSSQQVIMTKKSNQKLLDKLNDGIDKLIASGKMQQIEDKWLSAEPILPANVASSIATNNTESLNN